MSLIIAWRKCETLNLRVDQKKNVPNMNNEEKMFQKNLNNMSEA
jgi:hypothetical protein